MEAVAIAPAGLLTAHTIGGYLDGTVEAYRRVARAVQTHGTRLFVQLFHGGRELLASAPRPVAVSSSALPSHRYHSEPRALRTAEVEETVRAYGRCAALAAEAGLDGIEVTAAHGYLAEQFFNPAWNLRTDRYGEGSRFITEVLAAVREAAPGLALGVRLSADSAPAQAVAAALAPLVDYVHVAIGNSATFDGCVNIVPPPTVPQNAIADLTGAVPRRAAPDRDDAGDRPGRCRPHDRRAGRRRLRHEPGADHRSGDAAQGPRRRRGRDPALHRLQRLHRPLPRRDADPLCAEPANRRNGRCLARSPPRPRSASSRLVS